jgi:hypothetical protein
MHRSSRRSSNRFTKRFTSAAKATYRHFNHAGSSFGRWTTTDHTGMSRAMINMPSMGFWNTLRYIAMHFLIAVVGALVTGLMVFVIIYYGIPLLILGVL